MRDSHGQISIIRNRTESYRSGWKYSAAKLLIISIPKHIGAMIFFIPEKCVSLLTRKKKMKKFKPIVHSMRLRTLPLSLAGVLLGLLLANTASWPVFLLTLLTTVCLQILSNVSNELGDHLSGTDQEGRTGPAYSLQQGTLTERDLRRTIVVMAVLCAVFGTLMVWCSFGTLLSAPALSLLALGAAAIAASIRYTLGKNPYGYRGWGDLYVFLFFGLVSVMGGYYVAAHTLSPWLLLPASAVGCFSVGVLNVNNIRDMATDAGTRVTTPLRIGERNAKIYQTALIVAGWLMLAVYLIAQARTPWQWIGVVTLPLYVRHLAGVWRLRGQQLDRMLPLLVMSTFVLALLTGLPGFSF